MLPENLFDGGAGVEVVPAGVAELVELVEDDAVGPGFADLPALVVDLLDVGFAARGGDDLGADLLQPVEALAAHPLGQDGHGGAAHEIGIEGAAAAVVAGRRPDRLVEGRVELAADQARHQAAVGGADLVGAGGEPLADEQHDARLDPGQGRRQLQEIDAAEEAALLPGLVLPGDAEQVERVQVPEADLAQLVLDLAGDQLRVALLGEGGQDDVRLRKWATVLSRTAWSTTRSVMGIMQGSFYDRFSRH